MFGIALINIVGFLIMGFDKYRAKAGGQRIPEKNLFLVALIGGAAGVYLGMQVFRHKTKHKLFVLGIPILLVINIIGFYVILANNSAVHFWK